MTDELLELMAAEALKMAKTDIELKQWVGFLLASYVEDEGFERLRNAELLISEKAGENWFEYLRDRVGLLGLPDVLICVSTVRTRTQDGTTHEALLAVAQSQSRLCKYRQEMQGWSLIGEPQAEFFDQKDADDNWRLYQEPPVQ